MHYFNGKIQKYPIPGRPPPLASSRSIAITNWARPTLLAVFCTIYLVSKTLQLEDSC